MLIGYCLQVITFFYKITSIKIFKKYIHRKILNHFYNSTNLLATFLGHSTVSKCKPSFNNFSLSSFIFNTTITGFYYGSTFFSFFFFYSYLILNNPIVTSKSLGNSA